jgi:hypothetical protein
MFTGNTDPTPYLAGAYGVAFVLLSVYGFVQVRLRQRLRQLEQAAQYQNKRRT